MFISFQYVERCQITRTFLQFLYIFVVIVIVFKVSVSPQPQGKICNYAIALIFVTMISLYYLI